MAATERKRIGAVVDEQVVDGDVEDLTPVGLRVVATAQRHLGHVRRHVPVQRSSTTWPDPMLNLVKS